MPAPEPEKKLTPAMKQYARFKAEYPDCVLFFRMGDFYELFHEDARIANRVLGVALTARTEGVPMAGVPYHSVEGYLSRMIQAGYRVAVCDQVQDASEAKGVVDRDVTRVVTPGTLTEETLLEEGEANPIAAVRLAGGAAHVAWAELSTGAFQVASFEPAAAADELARIAPREILHPEAEGEIDPALAALLEASRGVPAPRPPWQFRHDEARQTLTRQFELATLAGIGFEPEDPLIAPAGALVSYLLETQRTGGGGQRKRLEHLRPPRRFERSEHLVIDQVSLRSLEIERTLRAGSSEGSLLATLQGCRTAMGKRQLRRWLLYPLADRAAIERRHRMVAAMVEDPDFRGALGERLGRIQDVARILARLSVGRASPRDLVALGASSAEVSPLLELVSGRPATEEARAALEPVAAPLERLASSISAACVEQPPAHLREGGLIRDGYDPILDEQRALERDSESWLGEYQKELTESTGISPIKVGYNKVFGYYIELTRANRELAPDHWTRKQTLKNAERFITPELKAYEEKVLSATHKAVEREQQLFAELSAEATGHLDALHHFGEAVATLDVLRTFAERAARFRYVPPEMADEPVLEITGGRHPVIEAELGDRFVPNDLALATAEAPATLALITGPNMAGKSTFIRQNALIVLLAHAGSFVPADRARIGLTDRIFTRVGASDELHTGQSTFMVEMTETANLCHHATDRSLVILDEIGRGTSTFDGLSLAWAIAEHLAGRGARTLFATHYHELTTLADRLERVANLNVSVREWQDEIVFLHRIEPGGADQSYGLHVAKLAGVPRPVIERAKEILQSLTLTHGEAAPAPPPARESTANPELPAGRRQLDLFTEYVEHPVVEALRSIELETLSPMEAFDRLRRLKEKLENPQAR